VVHEPVDERGGDHSVAEDLAPLLEAAVGGDDDRAALVTTGDERKEEIGRLPLEGQVADLVDDEQVVALESAQLGLELVAVLGRLEARDPLLRSGEGDPEAALARLQRERDREVGLAGAGRAEEADIRPLLDPGELRQVQDERALGRGLRAPVEVLERFQRREGGVADPHPRAGGVAGEDLGLEQALEKLLVRPLLGTGALGGLLQPLEHSRRLELGEQVGQPLALRVPKTGIHPRSCCGLVLVDEPSENVSASDAVGNDNVL